MCINETASNVNFQGTAQQDKTRLIRNQRAKTNLRRFSTTTDEGKELSARELMLPGGGCKVQTATL
jgi:hypothetical protein